MLRTVVPHSLRSGGRGMAAALVLLALPLAACQGDRYHMAPSAYDGVAKYCGQWPKDLGVDWNNRNYANFGCATENNLAAMVEDPRDLHAPRTMTPRDSNRRDEVFERYRRGEETAARTRTDDAGMIGEIGN